MSDYELGVSIGKSVRDGRDAAGVVFVQMARSEQLDDTTITEHARLLSPWAASVAYDARDVVSFGGAVFRCVGAHTSQPDWTPDKTPALWTKIGDPADEWPPWSQPLGAHDAYVKGDKVTHKAVRWISTADANVWEPGVYGWTEAK